MPCCYGNNPSDRKWCEDLKAGYTDAEGKEYCVFHAPQGKKGVSLEAFNELVFAQIRKAQEQHETCSFLGTIFEGDIDFSRFDADNPLPSIALNDAHFSGDANFKGTHFNGRTHFRVAQFSGNANFKEARFSGDANFLGAQFSRNASFGVAQFSENAGFGDVLFSENSGFMGAQFSGNAEFTKAQFNMDADFKGAQFSEDARFDFLRIKEKARLNFRDRDKNKTFSKEAGFSYLDIGGSLVFEGVDLSNASFINSQINRIDFVNVKWHRSGWRGWRDTLYDEIALFKSLKEDSVQDDGKPKMLYINYRGFKSWLTGERQSAYIRKVGILYRRMKDKYRTLQNWPEVSNWHYGEKEMYRKENAFRRYLPFSFSFLYWLSSGYGERYVKAGVVLAALVITLSFGLAWTGLDAATGYGSNPGDFHGIRSITLQTLDVKSIGAVLMNTLKYATFQKDIFFVPRNMWGELIRCIAQILIPVQTALFILAVRNRFRR